MERFEELSELAVDMMKEIGSIGTGYASTSLSSLLDKTVTMEVPDVQVVSFQEVMNTLGDLEAQAGGIVSEMSGDMNGIMLVMFRLDTINVITNSMIEEVFETYESLSELAYSAIIEIGNILISSYVNAIAKLAEFEIHLSVPAYGVNMIGAMLNEPLSVVGYDLDKILLIKGKTKIDNMLQGMEVIMLPAIDSLENLFSKMDVK